MPAWIRLFLSSLWIGVLGFCVINASWAAAEAPASTAPSSTSENPVPVGAAGQPVPNTVANAAFEKAAEERIGPLKQPEKSTLNKSVVKKTKSENQKEYTLLPKVRVEAGGDTQSKGIPIENLQSFFRFGLFMPEDCFLKLPRVSYAQDAHILSADRDLIYSTKVDGDVGDTVAIYRMGKRYVEPDTKEFLGYMAFKSAEAQILEKQDTEKKNNVVLQVKHNMEAIDKTMRITKEQWPDILNLHYLKPALIERPIEGYIIGVWDPGVTLIGKNISVVLSVGKREGISVGNLLEIYRRRDLLDTSIAQTDMKDRPEIRVGRVLVYQVDEKLSLGLITEVYEKIILFDKIRGEVLADGDDECTPKTLDAHFFDNTCADSSDDSGCAQAESKNLGEVLENAYEKSSEENCIDGK